MRIAAALFGVLGLAALLLLAGNIGASTERAKWVKREQQRADAVLKAQIARAAQEAQIAREHADEVERYQKEAAGYRAAGDRARTELERLRKLQAAASRGVEPDTTSAPARAAGADPGAGDVAGECPARLVEMGERAAGIAAVARSLQVYARRAHEVCGVPANVTAR